MSFSQNFKSSGEYFYPCLCYSGLSYSACNLDNILPAQARELIKELGCDLLLENSNLDHSFPVSQQKEFDSSEVSQFMDPSCNCYVLSNLVI